MERYLERELQGWGNKVLIEYIHVSYEVTGKKYIEMDLPRTEEL